MQWIKNGSVVLTLLLALSACTKERVINIPGNLVPYTANENPAIPSITVNGAILHSEAFGHVDSSIIVILHGGPGSDYRYLLKCKELADNGYRVVFYDQSGSGLSQRFSKSHYTNIQIMLDELSGVITHYKTHSGQKVFLLGHSWGGILATAYINQNPGAISGVVVAEPGGLIWKDILEYVNKSKSIKLTTELFNDQTYFDQFLTGNEDQHQILDYKYQIRSSADGNKDNPTGNEGPLPFWRFGAVISMALFDIGERTTPNWTTHLNLYTKKVLFIYSQNNKAYGDVWANKISSAFSNVELFKAVSAGHDMFSFQTGWDNTFPKILAYFNAL